MLPHNISEAAHWWWAERRDKVADSSIRGLISFLFQTIDSLYLTCRKFPATWSTESGVNIRSAGTYGMYLKLPLAPDEYATLRAAIGLAGDLFCILKRLEKFSLLELDGPIRETLSIVSDFRDVRNFFAHLDDRLINLDKHGISGAIKTTCGINYTEEAKGCFHLIMKGNTLHFSCSGRACEVNVGRDNFDRIFVQARNIYSVIISHELHKEQYNYIPVDMIYPVDE